jgi:uncharacterized peroxidase-related enzyme
MSFLPVPPVTPEAQRVFDEDMAEQGFVANASRLWAYQPETFTGLFALLNTAAEPCALGQRLRGILIAATASTLRDSYCSLAWGTRLASTSDAETAAGVLRGEDTDLTPSERVLAGWARQVAADPNATTSADVDGLRDAGFSDEEIFAVTVFVALRIALSTVNDALGARPDAAFRELAPEQVRAAVSYGRPVE